MLLVQGHLVHGINSAGIMRRVDKKLLEGYWPPQKFFNSMILTVIKYYEKKTC